MSETINVMRSVFTLEQLVDINDPDSVAGAAKVSQSIMNSMRQIGRAKVDSKFVRTKAFAETPGSETPLEDAIDEQSEQETVDAATAQADLDAANHEMGHHPDDPSYAQPDHDERGAAA